jgi:hypothetical protein
MNEHTENNNAASQIQNQTAAAAATEILQEGRANLNSQQVIIDRQAIGREFPVGWSTVCDEVTKYRKAGDVIFFMVSDYTDYALWDKFLYDILPNLDQRPDFRKDDGSQQNPRKEYEKLPVGDYMVFDIMHPIASDALYGKAGITKPSFQQLPAVYAITVGEETGRYVLNAEAQVTESLITNILAIQREKKNS